MNITPWPVASGSSRSASYSLARRSVVYTACGFPRLMVDAVGAATLAGARTSSDEELGASAPTGQPEHQRASAVLPGPSDGCAADAAKYWYDTGSRKVRLPYCLGRRWEGRGGWPVAGSGSGTGCGC